MRSTVLCWSCNCYFDIEAFEAADLKNPVCTDCREECKHLHIGTQRKDFGRCVETGYYDVDDVAVCRDCGTELPEVA